MSAPAPASHIPPQRIQRDLQARFNPIRGLTPERLASALEAHACGHIRAAARLWEAMQTRDPIVMACHAKRFSDAARQDWDILLSEESPEAEAHQEALREFYDQVEVTHVLQGDQRGGVRLLLEQMLDARAKGYAVHEIVWKPGPTLGAEFRHVPLWFFESTTGRLRFLAQEHATDGEAMPPEEWLVTVSRGLMEATSVAYLFKHFGMQAWVAFVEKFGTPGMLWKSEAAPGTPEREALEKAAAAFCRDWAGVCGPDVAVQLIEAATAAGTPHQDIIAYMDRVIAILWRGSDLGTISRDNGAGASQQGGEGDLLLEDDCHLLSETLQQRIDRQVIAYTFGPGVRPLAYFRVSAPERRDVVKEIAVDTFLRDSGAPLGQRDTLERYGRSAPEAGEDLLTAPAPAPPSPGGPARAASGDLAFSNEASSLLTTAKAQLAQAVAHDLQPLRKRLERILKIEDPEIQVQKLQELLADSGKLAKDILADPSSAKAMEGLITAGLFNGLTAKPTTTTQ